MKIALVQDELVRRGGGEQVCLSFHKAFPSAPIYTSTYNPELTYPEFQSATIVSSWFGKIAQNENQLKRWFFPFSLLAMRQLDLREYDIVLISGTNSGKYVRVSPKAIVITYCFTPFRLAWNPESYNEYKNASYSKRLVFRPIIALLRSVDRKYAKRTDFFLAMTEETRERIEVAYQPQKPISIIPPAVKINNFKVSSSSGDYYLLVSRLEFYKKVDLAIEAFNTLGLKLIIVGKGSQKNELVSMAKENIEFRSDLSKEELMNLYANCKAFIFPQHEDYGITPLEANASGKPVIAYKAGGVLTTQVEYDEHSDNGTALFFDQQTPQSLIHAVLKFETIQDKFVPDSIRNNAERFSESNFIHSIQAFVSKVSK